MTSTTILWINLAIALFIFITGWKKAYEQGPDDIGIWDSCRVPLFLSGVYAVGAIFGGTIFIIAIALLALIGGIMQLNGATTLRTGATILTFTGAASLVVLSIIGGTFNFSVANLWYVAIPLIGIAIGYWGSRRTTSILIVIALIATACIIHWAPWNPSAPSTLDDATTQQPAEPSTEPSTSTPDDDRDPRFIQTGTGHGQNKVDDGFQAELNAAREAAGGNLSVEEYKRVLLERATQARVLAIWSYTFGLYENPNAVDALVTEDGTYLSEEGLALYARFESAISGAQIEFGQVPGNWVNSGVSSDGTYGGSANPGITGNRDGATIYPSDGKPGTIMDRCGNPVTPGKPDLPEVPTDEPGEDPPDEIPDPKIPSQDPAQNGNDGNGPGNPNPGTGGGGQNQDPGPGEYQEETPDLPPAAPYVPPAPPTTTPNPPASTGGNQGGSSATPPPSAGNTGDNIPSQPVQPGVNGTDSTPNDGVVGRPPE
jgi:hypothetical protein